MNNLCKMACSLILRNDPKAFKKDGSYDISHIFSQMCAHRDQRWYSEIYFPHRLRFFRHMGMFPGFWDTHTLTVDEYGVAGISCHSCTEESFHEFVLSEYLDEWFQYEWWPKHPEWELEEVSSDNLDKLKIRQPLIYTKTDASGNTQLAMPL